MGAESDVRPSLLRCVLRMHCSEKVLANWLREHNCLWATYRKLGNLMQNIAVYTLSRPSPFRFLVLSSKVNLGFILMNIFLETGSSFSLDWWKRKNSFLPTLQILLNTSVLSTHIQDVRDLILLPSTWQDHSLHVVWASRVPYISASAEFFYFQQTAKYWLGPSKSEK